MELITSRRNPLVGRLRALHQPKGRREQGLLLLEGTHQLQELLRLGLQPEQVLATPAWIERNGGLLVQGTLPLQPVGDEVMAAVATTDHPDGVVATLAREALPVARGEGAFVLVLDQLQAAASPGRCAAAPAAAGCCGGAAVGGHRGSAMRPALLAARLDPPHHFDDGE